MPRTLFAEPPSEHENNEKSKIIPEPKVDQVKPAEQTAQELMLAQALEKIEQLSNKVMQLEEEKKNKPVKVDGAPIATPQNKKVPTSTPSPATATESKPSSPEPSVAGSDRDDDETGDGGKSQELMTFPNGSKVMTQDALRMRLRRLVEIKPKSKKCHVDEATRAQYAKGGEDREWLEIALMEAIQKVGADNRKHKALRVS